MKELKLKDLKHVVEKCGTCPLCFVNTSHYCFLTKKLVEKTYCINDDCPLEEYQIIGKPYDTP